MLSTTDKSNAALLSRAIVNQLLRPGQENQLVPLVASLGSAERCLNAARLEGLHSILGYQVTALSASTEENFRQAYVEDFSRHCYWIQLLKELNGALVERGLRAVALKGASVIQDLYPAAGMRPLSDIDLWIRREDYPVVYSMLKELGFANAWPGMDMVLTRTNWAIDLHFTPLNQIDGAFELNAEEAWATAIPLFEGPPGICRLSPELDLVVALIHATKHSFSRLIWLVDILLMLDRLPREKVVEVVSRCRAGRCLRYALWLSRELFAVTFPPFLHPGVPGDEQLNFFERAFLNGCMARDAPNVAGVVVLAFSARTPLLAASYLGSFLFPDSGIKARCVRLWELFLAFSSFLRRHATGSGKHRKSDPLQMSH